MFFNKGHKYVITTGPVAITCFAVIIIMMKSPLWKDTGTLSVTTSGVSRRVSGVSGVPAIAYSTVLPASYSL